MKAAIITVFFLCLFVVSIILTCVFRLLIYFPKPKDGDQCVQTEDHSPIPATAEAIERFAQAIRFKTITSDVRVYDKEQLSLFTDFIRKSFPRIHSSPWIQVERIANYSLLFTIRGSDTTLKPYMLCAHMDVVPVQRDKWIVDPFAGIVKDGYLYGRGTIDTKGVVMASLEALEYLLSKDFVPRRPFFLAFGHDEEGLGVDGAFAISKTLQNRGVHLEYILDEGTTILNGSFPGIVQPVALVSVSEKGFLTLELMVEGAAGHGAMPPAETTLIILSKAVSKLDSHALPSCFGKGPEKGLFEALAPYASFPYNLIYSNLWLFGSIFAKVYSRNPFGNALIRTTTALTVMNGGIKENVLPSTSRALINFRIHPSQTVSEVIDSVKSIVDDSRVSISVYKGQFFEAHPQSPFDDEAFGYQNIRSSVREVFPDVLVVPSIMLSATDTKWYLNVTKNVYRFRPVMLRPEELTLLHGYNERIATDNYVQLINYYHHLILSSDKPSLPQRKSKDEL